MTDEDFFWIFEDTHKFVIVDMSSSRITKAQISIHFMVKKYAYDITDCDKLNASMLESLTISFYSFDCITIDAIKDIFISNGYGVIDYGEHHRLRIKLLRTKIFEYKLQSGNYTDFIDDIANFHSDKI